MQISHYCLSMKRLSTKRALSLKYSKRAKGAHKAKEKNKLTCIYTRL